MGEVRNNKKKSRCGMVRFVIPLIGLVLVMCGFVWGMEPQAEQAQYEIQSMLEKALGYAAVYNYEKVEELCDQVLKMTEDKEVEARAHWLKAVAYAHFQLQYRTDKLQEKLDAETEMVRRLNSELLGDVLAYHEVSLKFYLTDKSEVDKFLKEAREAYEKKATTDAVSAYKLGHSYWRAAGHVKKESPEKSKEYYAQARKWMQQVMEMRPESMEYAAYYLTVLADMGLKQEAEQVGKRIVERFDPKPPLVFERDPYCLYAAAASLSEPAKYGEILRERAKSAAAGGYVYYEEALERAHQAASASERIKIWGELTRGLEEGEIRMSGYDSRALASAYYKLAHELNQQELPEMALATYRKLTELSPHYAEVHYNQGVVFRLMAEREADPAKKKELLERARKEFELQTRYDWQGRAAKSARRLLDQLPKP